MGLRGCKHSCSAYFLVRGLQMDLAMSSRALPANLRPACCACNLPRSAELIPKAAMEGRPQPFSTRKRLYMVGLFSAMMALLSADQNLLAPNVSGE